MNYFIRVLLALDQLANVVLCNGMPDETMSAVSYRMNRDGRFWGFMMPVIDLMFRWQGYPDHCYRAYLKEIARVQYPDEYKTKAKE